MDNLSEDERLLFEALENTGRPALRLTTAGRPGFSKIGGRPNLSNDLAWPYWCNRPLSFVAQLDLAELKAAETLPEFPAEGRLYFFYPAYWAGEVKQPWGESPQDRGSAVVLYSLAEPGPEIEPPEDMKKPGLFEFEDETTGTYVMRFLEAETIISLPWPDRDDDIFKDYVNNPKFEESFESLQYSFEEYLDRTFKESDSIFPTLMHLLGGYPIPEQGDDMDLLCQAASNGLKCRNGSPVEELSAELKAGVSDWMFLVQFDTDGGDSRYNDEGDYMAWGMDGGRLYFWIKKQDLAQRDFSRVWAAIQCT